MAASGRRILVVDDDPTFRDVLELRLQRWGYHVKLAEDARQASEIAESWKPHLILSDVVMPEASGLQLLQRLRADEPDRSVILLTAHATVEMAVDAMKLGAVDFLTKPLNYRNLRSLLDEALGDGPSGPPRRRNGAVAGKSEPDEELAAQIDPDESDGLGPFLGRSQAMREVYAFIRSVAGSDASVLITGESGTGKELAARTIHQLSRRREGPFIAVNAAAIPRDLMESEIFGHEKGAFTGATDARAGCFELADQGTLFLDEIGEMPKELQPKLLRVLDQARLRRLGAARELSFNVRTLSATNRDPRAAVDEGSLREDLFFRLNVFHLALPPLREREGDIAFLARRFAVELADRHGEEPRTIADDAIELLVRYNWPGNVRELRNLMERAVVLAQDGVIRPAHLPPYVRATERVSSTAYVFPPDATVADAERELILRTLDETDNNKTETARRLGVSVRTIHNKLKSYDLDG